MAEIAPIQVATIAEMARTIGVFCDEVTSDESMVLTALIATIAGRIVNISADHDAAYAHVIFVAAAIGNAAAERMAEKTGRTWSPPAP